MHKSMARFALIATVLLGDIITLLCFWYAINHCLLSFPFRYMIAFAAGGIVAILYAGLILLFVVRFFVGSKAKDTAGTVFYTVLLTQALTIITHAWLWILEEGTGLLWGSSNDYLNAFYLYGLCAIGSGILVTIIYNIVCAVRRKNEQDHCGSCE